MIFIRDTPKIQGYRKGEIFKIGKKMCYINTNQKNVGVGILISDKINFQTKNTLLALERTTTY